MSASGKGVHCKNCSLRESFRKFQRRYEPPTPEESAFEEFIRYSQDGLASSPSIKEYLLDRGFTEDTLTALRFGYFDGGLVPTEVHKTLGLADATGHWLLKDRVIIPYLRDGIPVEVRGRVNPFDPAAGSKAKYMERAGHKDFERAYYPATPDPQLPTVICEGEFDAALLWQHGIQALGVPGANTSDPNWFRGYADLYLAFDGDTAGRQGAATLLKQLSEVRHIALPEKMDCTDYIANFTIGSFQKLMEKATLYVEGCPQKDDRFAATVEAFSAWAFANGPLLGPRISWAPRLEKALSGWAPGLILMGAEANAGKSCFLVKSAYQAAIENPDDTVVVYLSLDDTIEEALQRLVSMHSGISFEKIRTPRYALAPHEVPLFHQAVEELSKFSNLVVRDATYGRSLNYIRNFIKSLRAKHPDKRIVLFIDSLAKITPDIENPDEISTGKSNWKAYLASELKYLTTSHKVCVVTPTDLRKLNDDRRPTRDDLKDAAELAYEANAVLLAYNDVNRRRDKATMTWTYGLSEEHPLFEVIIDKNKLTTYKGTIRYEFYGPCSEFNELTTVADEAWNTKIRDERAASKP